MISINEIADRFEQETIEFRRKLHAHPELGGQEAWTQEFIVNTLKETGLTPNTAYSQHCVTAVLTGDPCGKTVMLRADIDALPIQEESGCPFSSENEGIMHACGHDLHTAALLGAAKILFEIREQLGGTVKFLFQPAEEVKDIGACICVKEGVLENPKVDLAVGVHIDPSYPVGSVSLEAGPVSSYPDGFRIRFMGKASHGSRPDLSIDAIRAAVAAYHMVTDLNLAVSAMEPHVVQVCMLQGGVKENICADECVIAGTCRTVTYESRVRMKNQLEQIAKSVCEIYGTTYEFKGFTSMTTPVVNDPGLTVMARESIKKVAPLGLATEPCNKMGGEDFSYYTTDTGVPGLYARIGTHNADPATWVPVHNGKLLLDEKAVSIAARVYAQIALDYLNGGDYVK